MHIARFAGLLLSSSLLVAVAACAESATDIPGEGVPEENNSAVLPPPSNPPGPSSTSSGGSTSSSGGSSSGGSTSSSGGSTSSSGGSSIPACSWAGDLAKVLAKIQEITAGAPCDSSCNASTHCCLDLLGGAGGSSGLPGGSSGLPGGSSGLPGGSSSGGLPGGGGVCVSK